MKFSVGIMLAVVVLGARLAGAQAESGALVVRPLASPAGEATGEANLARHADGSLYLSWVAHQGEDTTALVLSRLTLDTSWSTPVTVARGADWFVNWADFPAVAATENGFVTASWLAKVGGDTYAYDIRAARSRDGGLAWGASFALHDDTSATEHGFVSLTALAADQIGAVWLDGREMVRENGPMTLRFAQIGADGAISESRLLDARVCDCCQTSSALTGDGTLVVVYRDRSDTEVRDISIVRRAAGQWTAPAAVCNDGWKIDGCPVNGPSVAARDSMVAVAWFTMGAQDSAMVNVAFSSDNGATFGTPITVDGCGPIGRTDIAMLDPNTAIVVWLEKKDDEAAIMARTVASTGEMSAPALVALTSSSRASGFPRIENFGDGVVVVWTDVNEESRVKTAVVGRE